MDLLIRCNVGHNERIFRGLLGLAAFGAAYYVNDKATQVGLGALGLSALASSVTRYSLINQLMGREHCQGAYRSVRQSFRRL